LKCQNSCGVSETVYRNGKLKYKKEADMVVRKYRDVGYSEMVAGIIAGEVVESGKSDGWQGSG